MAEISGLAGAVGAMGCGTLTFRSWTISYTQATVDTTTFSETGNTRTRAPGILEWSGSAEAILDGAASCALPTTEQAGVFTAASGRTWTGQVVITGLTPNVVVDGEATCAVTFDGTGALTIN